MQINPLLLFLKRSPTRQLLVKMIKLENKVFRKINFRLLWLSYEPYLLPILKKNRKYTDFEVESSLGEVCSDTYSSSSFSVAQPTCHSLLLSAARLQLARSRIPCCRAGANAPGAHQQHQLKAHLPLANDSCSGFISTPFPTEIGYCWRSCELRQR